MAEQDTQQGIRDRLATAGRDMMRRVRTPSPEAASSGSMTTEEAKPSASSPEDALDFYRRLLNELVVAVEGEPPPDRKLWCLPDISCAARSTQPRDSVSDARSRNGQICNPGGIE